MVQISVISEKPTQVWGLNERDLCIFGKIRDKLTMLFWVSESFWSVPNGEFVLDGTDECWYCWYNRQIIPEHRQNFWLPFVSSDIRYRPSTIIYVSTKITGGSDA